MNQDRLKVEADIIKSKCGIFGAVDIKGSCLALAVLEAHVQLT